MERRGYNTKPRRMIIEFLENNADTTVSAADIENYLKNRGVTVNFATVYRYLSKLSSENKVIKFSRDDGQRTVYQLVKTEKDCDDHLHMQCVKCGKLMHLDCDFMEDMAAHLEADHGFKLKCAKSILYGVCKDCRG